MNFGSNAALDLAELRTEQEREAEIAAVRAALGGAGSEICEDCGRPISAARRLAMPSARRCIECQAIHEQEKYHR